MPRQTIKRKKAGALALLLIAALLLSACAPQAAAPTVPPQTPAPAPPEESAAPRYPDTVVISEIMAKNRTTVDDGSACFPDWIELHNTGDESVDLDGWTLSDRDNLPKAMFPPLVLEPDGYLLIFAGKDHAPAADELLAPFGISAGETVYLRAPDGELKAAAEAGDMKADISAIRGGGGEYRACAWPTPGFANTPAGFDSFQASRENASPLKINEVLVKNESFLPSFLYGTDDIVELKNVSDAALWLGDYAMSDKKTGLRCTLPDVTLQPGELFLVFCCGEERSSAEERFYAPIALNSNEDELYLYGADGRPADCMTLRQIPAGGSYGRMPDGNGLFYFSAPTPGEENRDGRRFIAPVPAVDTEPGVYPDAQYLTVSLSAAQELDAGEETRIYYTLDGTRPDESSALYTGPVTLTENTVVRAVAVGEDSLPGEVGTYTYLLREHHSLPVLNITVDDLGMFKNLYYASAKSLQTANAAYFNGEHSFNKDGLVRLRGHTSLDLPKKSLGLYFPDRIDGPLEADVFGNGVTTFTRLHVRAGQDNLKTLFRTELIQDLVLESSTHLLSQSSQFCVVYINGAYWGLYALKEDLNEQYYAEHYHVSPESVIIEEGETALASDFYKDVVEFTAQNDMRDAANYEKICRTIDIDSFIDWIIFEGYSGNTDTLNNIMFFRSTEGDGLWRWALLDLDWAFQNPEMDYRVIMNSEANAGFQMYSLMMALFQNDGFKARFLRRFGELNRTTLSNAHVSEAIERYVAMLEPEIERDEPLRDSTYLSWQYYVDELRNFITEFDRENHNVRQIALFLNMSEEEVRAAMAAEQ